MTPAKNQSKSSGNIAIISIVIILVVVVALLFIFRGKNPLKTALAPTESLSTQNVDSTLSQTQSDIDQSLNQADQDFSSLDQNDVTSDNTNNI